MLPLWHVACRSGPRSALQSCRSVAVSYLERAFALSASLAKVRPSVAVSSSCPPLMRRALERAPLRASLGRSSQPSGHGRTCRGGSPTSRTGGLSFCPLGRLPKALPGEDAGLHPAQAPEPPDGGDDPVDEEVLEPPAICSLALGRHEFGAIEGVAPLGLGLFVASHDPVPPVTGDGLSNEGLSTVCSHPGIAPKHRARHSGAIVQSDTQFFDAPGTMSISMKMANPSRGGGATPRASPKGGSRAAEGGFRVYWIAVSLAGGSLFVSVAILVVVWLVLRSTRRAEQTGEERLEMLREQQERLLFLREERRMLEEELEWRRSMMDREHRLLELEAPLESAKTLSSNGHSKPEQPESRSWWRRIVRAVGSSTP